jgi:O-antigen/teichoic acid export membrane protein
MADSQPFPESAAARGRAASPERRIGLAATTGIAGKVLALAAQVLAVAIAVRALGAEGFALYVVIASLVSWIGLAGLGVAPGLTLGMARASAIGDRAEEARLFAVALVLMTAIATIVVASAVLLSATGLVGHLTADWLQSASGDASAALLCMTVLIAVQLVVVVPEAAQLGLQRQHVSNIWAGIGSAAAIVAMLTVGGAVNSVTAFVLVSQGPQVTARVANAASFVLGRRYLLRPAGLRLRQYVRPILGSGLAFAGFSVASYVGLQVGLLVMAATVDAPAVALAGVIVRGHLMQASGLSVVTTPTWPAIANAVARGDLAWVRRTYRVLALGGLAYSTVVAVPIFFGLEALIGLWTGSRPADNVALRALLATFVVVNGWGHVNAMTLVGLGILRFTAIILVAEAVIVLALQIALIPVAGVTGYVAALLIGAVTFNGWILALRVRRELARDAVVRARSPGAE